METKLFHEAREKKVKKGGGATSRLADYFAIVGAERIQDMSFSGEISEGGDPFDTCYRAKVLFKYPEQSYPDSKTTSLFWK